MKKVLFIPLVVLLFTACMPILPSPWSKYTMTDYSMFARNGIFVTESNSVSFDYKPIGSINLLVVGGWVRKDGKKAPADPKEDFYIGSTGRKKIYKGPEVKDVFNAVIDNMKSIGANGIINLKIIYDGYNMSTTSPERIRITGMAIKR